MSLKHLIPAPLLSAYHFAVALLSAAYFGFPSRALCVIAVTGTKGKTSTTEMLSAIFEAAGQKSAVSNSIREKIGTDSHKSPSGRSMPGRGHLQRFLRSAVSAGCEVAIIEMTSEGARQHRHRGIALDALVFLNLAPEHIESHGSFEAYADAKFSLGLALARSFKRPRVIVAHQDDAESARYLMLPVEKKVGFSLNIHAPKSSARGGTFQFAGTTISVSQPGDFSLENALAAAETAQAFGIAVEHIAAGLASVAQIAGRAQRIDEGQDFTLVVDYAHTPESLAALLTTYAPQRRICVLGSAGGGRDTWKRPLMGKIAEEHADIVILTTDDPYDDDPAQIAAEMASGMKKAPEIILDRRLAIRRALELARSDSAVLITGKGVDPMYGKGGAVLPWNDVEVAREELARLRGVR